MVRNIILGALGLGLMVVAEPAGAAERTGHAQGQPAAGSLEARGQEAPLELIADEAAEVGAEGSEQDGMSRTADEMIDAENEDGCSGAMAAQDDDGCDGAL